MMATKLAKMSLISATKETRLAFPISLSPYSFISYVVNFAKIKHRKKGKMKTAVIM